MRKSSVLVAAASLLCTSPVAAADFFFSGSFARDDQVALFNIVLGSPANVTLGSLGFAGGMNSAGQTVAGGGFDSMLFLYDSAGSLIAGNDDGPTSFDALLQGSLPAGSYTLALTQYLNEPVDISLSSGFLRTGQANFTTLLFPDCGQPMFNSADDQDCGRTGNWALDIRGVTGAAVIGGGVAGVPEPATWATMLLGFGVLGAAMRRRRQKVAARIRFA